MRKYLHIYFYYDQLFVEEIQKENRALLLKKEDIQPGGMYVYFKLLFRITNIAKCASFTFKNSEPIQLFNLPVAYCTIITG